MNSEKTAVISGVSGFVGSHIREYLCSLGWETIGAGRDFDSDIYFNLDDPITFSALELSIQANVFIHVAAAHEITCKEKSYDAVSYNVLGTKSALEFSVKNKIPIFIYISTFHVYGNPHGEITEAAIPAPTNEYGLTHYFAEQYVEMFHRNGLLKGVSLRPTNLYGKPLNIEKFNRWTLIPYAFCEQAINDKAIVLNTTGEQQRNFVDVFDICHVIEKILEKDDLDQIIHVYSEQVYSIADFALMVKNVLKDEYNYPVNVTIGEKEVTCDNFNFKSKCLGRYIDMRKPTTLRSFISEFCNMLMRKKDGL